MTHVDLSGILLVQNVYDEFFAEVYAYLSDGSLSFGELVSLGGSLANKVSYFESLSAEQKVKLLLEIVMNAVKKVSLDNPSLSEKLNDSLEFVKQVLPSVLKTVDSASKNALARPVKEGLWYEFGQLFSGVFHTTTCSTCQNVEVPTVMIKHPSSDQKETQVVLTPVIPAPVIPAPIQANKVSE